MNLVFETSLTLSSDGTTQDPKDGMIELGDSAGRPGFNEDSIGDFIGDVNSS